jgi:hypothetical protein
MFMNSLRKVSIEIDYGQGESEHEGEPRCVLEDLNRFPETHLVRQDTFQKKGC